MKDSVRVSVIYVFVFVCAILFVVESGDVLSVDSVRADRNVNGGVERSSVNGVMFLDWRNSGGHYVEGKYSRGEVENGRVWVSRGVNEERVVGVGNGGGMVGGGEGGERMKSAVSAYVRNGVRVPLEMIGRGEVGGVFSEGEGVFSRGFPSVDPVDPGGNNAGFPEINPDDPGDVVPIGGGYVCWVVMVLIYVVVRGVCICDWRR